MKLAGTDVFTVRRVDEYGHVVRYVGYYCQGCWGTHYLPVDPAGPKHPRPNWDWNGDVEKPTLRPSIMSRSDRDGVTSICHHFLVDGQIQFLGDCTNTEVAGKTLPLQLLPDYWRKDDGDAADR